jgi:uncharacterized protein YndB with AHSA1/START domain
MKNSEIIKTVFLPVDMKTAWGYLTEPDKLAKWFHAPKTPLAAGEDYVLYGTDSGNKMCWGHVSVANPHSELAYSFSITPAPDLETQVHWALDELDGGTRITMTHTGVGAAGMGLLSGLDVGWDKHFASLRGTV